MTMTKTKNELYSYCDTHDFAPSALVENFKKRLEEEGEDAPLILSVALEKFRVDTCPNCTAAGHYKWHFMGKLKHPDCGWEWLVGPGTYMAKQLGAVFKIGAEVAAEGFHDVDKKTGERGGCMGAIFGFVFGRMFGIVFRLPFALIMIPIQAIASLTQKKPETKAVTA